MKHQSQNTAPAQQTAILVAVSSKSQSESKTKEYLQELDFLTATLGIKVLKHFTQRLDRPESSSYIGKGKLEEIRLYTLQHMPDFAIFDDELTASQVKNINNELKISILDRSLLILEIFEGRAQSAQSRTQVELAKNQYLLPRLTNMWSHLERQRGGTGTRGGSGEKEIETDRRVIKARISFLKDELKKIDVVNLTQRKNRTGIVRVAIVGYTNVGKSTLMNLLTKADILAENKLFATVDATVRKLVWETIPFLISDTVGFIRKLPHQLIESFKSTLDEVSEADLLLHIVDVSHATFEEQIEVVNKTLTELKANDKPIVLVFNKIDQLEAQMAVENEKLDEEQKAIAGTLEDRLKGLATIYANESTEVVFISATEKENIEDLREKIMNKVKAKHMQIYPNFVLYEV
ncbi:MAG: GTPase HflX [Cytophagales bacterium]